MGRVTTANYAGTAETTFQWATDSNDRFSRELDLYRLARALEIHDHSAGKGLAVARIQNGLVGEDQLAADAVTGPKLADNAIESVHVALNALGALDIATGAIGTDEIADNAITQAKMGDSSVGTNELANTSVTQAKMALLAIATGNIIDGAVGGTKIGTNQVSTNHYAPGSVDVTALGANAVNSSKVLDASLGGADIGNDQISTNHYAPGSVDTAAVGDAQITPAKLSVTLTKIATGSYAGDGTTTTKATGFVCKYVEIRSIGTNDNGILFRISSATATENLREIWIGTVGVNAGKAFINICTITALHASDGFTVDGAGTDNSNNAGSTYRWVAWG